MSTEQDREQFRSDRETHAHTRPPGTREKARRWRDVVLIALAPALLVTIASVHAVRHVTVDQSAWKGGGFGMFSTIDNEASRVVRVRIDLGNGWQAISPPPWADEFMAEIRVAPSAGRAKELATRLQTKLATVTDDLRGVAVEVWGMDASLESDDLMRLTLEPIHQVRVR